MVSSDFIVCLFCYALRSYGLPVGLATLMMQTLLYHPKGDVRLTDPGERPLPTPEREFNKRERGIFFHFFFLFFPLTHKIYFF